MSWQDVGVIVAMVGVIGGFILTWRGQGQDKRIAEASAERSEAAARLSADNTERVLLALEEIAAKDFTASVAVGAAPDPRVRWTLQHHAGDTYALTNTGGASAYAVELSGHETLIGPDRVSGGPDLAPDEALTFVAARSLATSDSTITVSWADSPTAPTRHEWKYPLPPRPPRR